MEPENIQNTETPEIKTEVPVKKTTVSDVTLKIRESFKKAPDFITSPKNRKFLVMAVVVILLILLLIIASLFKGIKKTVDNVPAPTPSFSPRGATEPGSIESKLDSLRDDLTRSSFEEKSLVPPDMLFKIEVEDNI